MNKEVEKARLETEMFVENIISVIGSYEKLEDSELQAHKYFINACIDVAYKKIFKILDEIEDKSFLLYTSKEVIIENILEEVGQNYYGYLIEIDVFDLNSFTSFAMKNAEEVVMFIAMKTIQENEELITNKLNSVYNKHKEKQQYINNLLHITKSKGYKYE